MRKSIRTGFLTTLTISAYGLFFFQLFMNHNIIGSLIGILVFFVIFHFFYIDIYPKDNKKTILVILSITLFEILLVNQFTGGNMIGGIIITNITILYLGFALKASANESISFKASNYFRSGGYIFTMGMAVAYSLFSIGLYNKFPFDCTYLSEKSGKVVEIITQPMNINLLQNQDPGKLLTNTKVKDILAIGKLLNIESEITGVAALETFKTRKNNLITKTINDNKELNQGICEFSLKKLNEKLKYPGFQASVIVLMVAVAYPFLRIVIQIMSIIGLLMFLIMKKANIYTIQKVITEVEKIG